MTLAGPADGGSKMLPGQYYENAKTAYWPRWPGIVGVKGRNGVWGADCHGRQRPSRTLLSSQDDCWDL